MLSNLEAAADFPAIPMSRHSDGPKPYTNHTDTATHVYIREDNPQGLQPRFHGPHLIKRRVGDTTIEVKTGTYKSGKERLELHSWNNAKPAFLAEGMKPVDRPKLGRPAKTDPPPSSEADTLLTPKSKDASKPVSKQPPASSTHQMTLRNRQQKQINALAPNSNTNSSEKNLVSIGSRVSHNKRINKLT